jgi:hypothetical protein
MYCLNPRNWNNGVWDHAKPKPVELVDENVELGPGMSYNDFLLTIHSRSAFETVTTTPIVNKKKGEQAQINCKTRDSVF